MYNTNLQIRTNVPLRDTRKGCRESRLNHKSQARNLRQTKKSEFFKIYALFNYCFEFRAWDLINY